MSTTPRRLGKYELQEQLGRGGMGEVWKAFDTQLQRHVAIKLLHADLQSDPNFITRFQREAQVIASLHHPNIVQIYDFQISKAIDKNDSVCYMVMDYVEGQTLAHYIRSTSRVGRFPDASDIIHLIAPISMAIDYAHQKGMIHRDIKPSNILLDKRPTESKLHPNFRSTIGEPILTDFGIVKLLGTPSGTLSGWWFGTPHYTSPEQANGNPGDERSDLYSFGVILYEIFTGVLPFHGDNPASVLIQHINAIPTLPSIINPNVTPALTAIIMRCLAKDPSARYTSASAIVVAVCEALNKPIPDNLRQHTSTLQGIGGTSTPLLPTLQVPLTPNPLSRLENASLPSNDKQLPITQGTSSDKEHYVMVREFVGGSNLEEYMGHLNQPLEEKDVLIYASQLLDSLDDMAQQTPPVVHGDIKPANIIIGRKDRRAHLVGFTSVTSDTTSSQWKHTPSAGTPGYAPLELLQGVIDPRSDLYSLAATMHFLLTNRNPRNNPPFNFPPVRMLNSKLTPDIERVLQRALMNDINIRYQNAVEMKRDIDDILLRYYGISSQGGIFILGASGPINAIKPTNSSIEKKSFPSKVTGGIQAILNLGDTSDSLINKQSQSIPLQAASNRVSLPGIMDSSQSKQKRNRWIVLALVLFLLFLLIGGTLLYPWLTSRSAKTTSSTNISQASMGIGVTQVANKEYIGLSDGTFSFDTNRADGNMKQQASTKLKAGDTGSAQTLWQSALALPGESNDAESLIYIEDQRVLASGYPYLTIVVGTMLTDPGNYSVGRGDLQGAYVAQKEYNDGFKLNGVLVRLLIANSGTAKEYALPVAKQIVQAAKTDKTIIGVMGWPFSSRTLNAINILASAHIPMVSQSASSVALTGISRYFFRVNPPDNVQAIAGAKYAEQTLHAHSVALFEDPGDPYSKSLADGFRKQFTSDGNTIIATEQYTVNHPEKTLALVQDALAHKPDFIYFSGYSNDVSVVITNLPTSGPQANLVVMGGDGLYILSGYTKEAHAQFGRLRFTAFAYPDEWDVQNLGSQKPPFFREYSENFNPSGEVHTSPYGYTRPDNEVMLAFDATSTLLNACQIALANKKSITPDDLRQALTMLHDAQSIQGVSGQIAFGPDGNPINKAVVILSVSSEGYIQIKAVQGQFLKTSK